MPIWIILLIFRYIKTVKVMATNKDKGGFISGVGHLISILLLLGLVYWFINWLFTSSIGEKIIFLVILFIFFLFYSWGTTLM
ncbi:hypothetical protein immuto35A_122 [Flavobacterium phage vB_FspM_immuto_3-5A]|uniref:Uncharacterized protein n=1 Tax=Flavobacterium phage vB_FspM_immuto_2-6A TaxID=2801477 RepID=A0A7T8IWY6_9CAUD|nr:hypothetical protein KNV73_gp148 [Flavobacterium phage vB_FspM_immuto_2-6A]QQO91802.1 hypothetical protein immuto26A_123 [Flavobacterium phage vB_FspM_immuto_2-6A]QQO92040.1 hypothetical protein immuto35A_122 [Flavobacterium phage vB_FspM_immuto_3-5A]QQO92278.1 hypothetical protein immuto136C_122 [Flavobacterium phage vB_FspM_immuto_13-6C]